MEDGVWRTIGGRRIFIKKGKSVEEAVRESRKFKSNKDGLSNRLSGDELLDAQELVQELKDVGAKIDNNGYVTVYHQTTNDNAKKIRESGYMIANEDYVYFSTSKKAQQSAGRGNTKLEFKIPVEKLELDDIFSDNADVKIHLKGNKKLNIIKYIKR